MLKPDQLSGALSLAGVLQLLSQNEIAIRFISPTAAMLPGLDRWIGNFEQITLTDSYDGRGQNPLVASGMTTQDFGTPADAVTYLMQNEDVQAQLSDDDYVMSLHPIEVSAQLSEGTVCRLLTENRIATTLKPIEAPANYADFRKSCRAAGLSFTVDAVLASMKAGGKPFQVTSEDDWNANASQLCNQDMVCFEPAQGREFSIECIAMRDGIALSPLQKLSREHFWGITHWTGAMCDPFIDVADAKACTQLATKAGKALSGGGLTGAFSIEMTKIGTTGKLLVSRVTPGLSVNSLLAHRVTMMHGGFPLHLLHIICGLGKNPTIDVDSLRGRYDCHDHWSVLAVRHSGPTAEMITRAPQTGLYQLDDGDGLTCIDPYASWQNAMGQKAFYLRLQGAGNYRAPGTLLGLIFLRAACLDDLHMPNKLGREWLTALGAAYAGLPVSGSSLPAGITTQPFADIL